MVKELILSFKENIKSKTTNPFYGTLIIVYIIHNWELIYTFFNFEKTKSLAEKVTFLKSYLDPVPFLKNLTVCILISFAVLLISFALLNLSRLITNFYENIITPWIYKITDYTSIVLKSDFEKVTKERDDISDKLNIEREQKLKLQKEIESLEKIIAEGNITNTTPVKEINTERVEQLVRLIKDEKLIKFLDNLINDVNNRSFLWFSSEKESDILELKNFNYFMKLDMIKIAEENKAEHTKRYEFTPLGQKVKQQIIDQQMLSDSNIE